MSRRFASIALLLILLTSLLGMAVWGARAMHYVPSPDQIQSRDDFRPFLVEPSAIEGVYGNLDVDSAVFSYTPGVDEEEFWRRIEQRVRDTRWVAVAPEGEVRRYQRVIPPEGQQVGWWVDELRVRYHKNSRTVVVGWVQADPRHAVAGLEECSEADFAERAIWPHLRGE